MTSQRSWVLSKAVTVDTNIYAAGDNVGGLLTFENALDVGFKTGKITNVIISDLAKQAGDFDVVIFDANPSATTFTNNAALDIADADITKIAAVISLTTSVNFADNEIVISAASVGYQVRSAGTTLYAAIVARSTPTFAATTDLAIKIQLEQDLPN